MTPTGARELSALIAGGQLKDSVFRAMVEALPVAIYTTDAEGRLTYFNKAAVKLSGRSPEVGTDQWCVTWKIFLPDGTYLPHDQCPMAIALKEGRPIRNAEAIAERRLSPGLRVLVIFPPCRVAFQNSLCGDRAVSISAENFRAKGVTSSQ